MTHAEKSFGFPHRGPTDWDAYSAATLMPLVVDAVWRQRTHGRSFIWTIARFMRLVGVDLGEAKANSDDTSKCLASRLRAVEKAALALAIALEELDEHACPDCGAGGWFKGTGPDATVWTLPSPGEAMRA